jgi:hypothetical protein
MLRRLALPLLLCILLTLAACSSKPYGHYEDDKMIGNIERVELENNVVEVDISEWSKRDIRGNVDDYGVTIPVKITDDLIIKKEDGTLSNINSLEIGQKVLINPPKKSDEGIRYKAKEIILLEMSYEEKYKRLLSHQKGKYLTTVFVKEGDSLPAAMEDTLMGLLPKSPINFGVYQEDFIVDYKQEMNIEKFPVILVFDTKGLVFKTYDVDELEAFFKLPS